MTKQRADRADMIVETIADFRMTYGYGPTVRELRDRCGLASTAAVQHHLMKLEREGRITKGYGKARTLATTGTVIEDDSADAILKAVHNDPGVGGLRVEVQDRLARFYRRLWAS